MNISVCVKCPTDSDAVGCLLSLLVKTGPDLHLDASVGFAASVTGNGEHYR